MAGEAKSFKMIKKGTRKGTPNDAVINIIVALTSRLNGCRDESMIVVAFKSITGLKSELRRSAMKISDLLHTTTRQAHTKKAYKKS